MYIDVSFGIGLATSRFGFLIPAQDVPFTNLWRLEGSAHKCEKNIFQMENLLCNVVFICKLFHTEMVEM